MKSLLEARWWGPCTLGLSTLSSLPSHTSNHCLHFHTQHEGTQGGSMEVSPSLWAERDTGHFALSTPQPQDLACLQQRLSYAYDCANKSPEGLIKCGIGPGRSGAGPKIVHL